MVSDLVVQRESISPLRLADVFYVLGLRKNLLFIAVLENHGYDVMFIKGNVFLKHVPMGQVK